MRKFGGVAAPETMEVKCHFILLNIVRPGVEQCSLLVRKPLEYWYTSGSMPKFRRSLDTSKVWMGINIRSFANGVQGVAWRDFALQIWS
jgi:hypothetical protein